MSTPDIVALISFFAIWVGYNTLVDGRFRSPRSINAKMIQVRRAWMRELLARDNRIADATLIGLSVRSATFFASTTIILIAGLLGVLGSADIVHARVVNLNMLLHIDSQVVTELRIALLIVILIYAFFKFTWAIRQFNYFSGVVGSAPRSTNSSVDDERADRMAMILSQAVWQINAGVRAYYYAFAAFGWFVHPLAFVVLTVVMTAILVRRQLYSATARAIADHVECLGRSDPGTPRGGPSAPPPPPALGS